ncbi:leucine-rich repeat-containing protein 34-like isoform X2 [Bombus huntii]|uniref:leucine-rich repeat-containing protein 34-like isoform X2 n=1 Tax=Bombus huntii TaxID=85661 RepID=UPI0021A97EBB|nr:leucine-rich repeat-containing protein 34-like isoform X2 [Bombus huntii]
MKFNKYQCPLSCTDCGKVNVFNVLESVKPPYFHQISLCFFKCFCKTICSTEKILNMRGPLVYEKLGRHLQDIDIPVLLIFLKENQDITHLNLASNNISDTGFINLLDHLLLYKNIQELDVQNNNIANYGIDYMLECAKNLELRNLNLRANKFVNQNTKNIALFLLENKYMCSLNIADVNQTASDLIYFMMVLSSDQEVFNETLKSLDISGPNPGCMYYFDSAHFADVIGHMLKCNTTLRALHLQKYNFSCHNIEIMMSNAKHNDSLHLLDLGCNNIGDHGIDHISAWLTKRPALKTLILCKNIITDHGARSLSCAIPFSKLLFLDISHNKITDDGIVNILYTLKKTPLLRQLRVFGNCIGHQAAKVLVKSAVTFTSTALGTDHARDCKCCYCFKCEVPYYDKQCKGADHPDTCTCCKCKGDESSDWSINKSVLNRIVSPSDPMKNIEHILKQVNSMTKEDISRWFNINNDILEEDFKLIDPNGRKSTKNTTLCKCSWMQLSTSVLQKYLQKSPSKDLVIIPRDDFIYLNSMCKNVCTKTSSLVYCSNV